MASPAARRRRRGAASCAPHRRASSAARPELSRRRAPRRLTDRKLARLDAEADAATRVQAIEAARGSAGRRDHQPPRPSRAEAPRAATDAEASAPPTVSAAGGGPRRCARPRRGPRTAGAERLASVDGVLGHAARPRRDRRRLGGGGRGRRRRGPRRRRRRRRRPPCRARRAWPTRHRRRHGAVLALAATRPPRPAPPIGEPVRRHVRRRPLGGRACSTPCSLAPSPSTADGGAIERVPHTGASSSRAAGDSVPPDGASARPGPVPPALRSRRRRDAPARRPTADRHDRARLPTAELAAGGRQAEPTCPVSSTRNDGRLHGRHRRAPAREPSAATPPPSRSRCGRTPTSWAERLAERAPSPSSRHAAGPRGRGGRHRRAGPRRPTPAHLESERPQSALRADLEVRSARPRRAPPVPRRPTGGGRGPAGRVRRGRPRGRAASRPSSMPSWRRPTTSPRWSPDREAIVETELARPASGAVRARRSGPPPCDSTSSGGPAVGRTTLDEVRERSRRSSRRPRPAAPRVRGREPAARPRLEPEAADGRRVPQLPEASAPSPACASSSGSSGSWGRSTRWPSRSSRAAGAPRLPGGAARGRQVDPPRAAKLIKAIDTEIVRRVRRRLRRRDANFEALFETLFPGGRAAPAHHPDNLLETGIEVEASRPARTCGSCRCCRVASGAHRAGVPVRRVPQPAVALLRDGRGRGRPRRRQPPPLPRPRRTSSARRPSSSSSATRSARWRRPTCSTASPCSRAGRRSSKVVSEKVHSVV